jgi:hypothetical protein
MPYDDLPFLRIGVIVIAEELGEIVVENSRGFEKTHAVLTPIYPLFS